MTALRTPRAVDALRIGEGVAVLMTLGVAYGARIAEGDPSPFDFFGYFTNQTSLLTAAVLLVTGVFSLRGLAMPDGLSLARGAATACMIVVGVVYNVLVPGTGSAALWVSVTLHIALPLLVALDWLLVGERPPLPWRRLWAVIPYPALWLVGVLVRGATDGWVPYGFLLPERGALSLALHVAGLFAALVAAGALVWAASRGGGARPRPARATGRGRMRASREPRSISRRRTS